MKKKALFIYNMYSGKAKIKSALADIINEFTKNEYEIVAHPTQYRGEAINKVAEMEDNYDVVICGGGDGTLDEVVTGMMKRDKKIPIGYIPAGSTNDFAKSIGVPSRINEAVSSIIKGSCKACDIGEFNETSFVYIAAFGLFTDVSYETDQQIKNMLGHMAYILEGAKRLGNIPSCHMKISVNGNEIEDDFIFGMITNSKSVGGFKTIVGKEVVMDDGVFEVVFIKKPNNILEANEIITSLLTEKMNSKYIYFYKSNEIKITSDKNIPWTLDGEYGGSHNDVKIKNINKGLNFIIE